MDESDSEFVRHRVAGDPDETYVTDYRLPQWSFMTTHLWDPIVRLNRVQTVELAAIDVLDGEEAAAILDALETIDETVQAGVAESVRRQHEDPYLYLEHELVERLGDETGGKIHSGRSRNDLLGAAVRIAMREQLCTILAELLDLRAALLETAAETVDVVFPAFTHSQPAQPITFAHYLLAFDATIARDVDRIHAAFEATNRSPLGAAAVGGTRFPLDRERLARLAGFDGVHYNTYDAIAAVDFIPQATNALATLMTNISRISRDYIEWSMFEFDFLEIDDGLATVSTIMPQKKNPSVLEKTRAAAGDTIGAATSATVHLQGSRFGDAGERSRYAFVPFLEEAVNVSRTIRLFRASVETTAINPDRMYEDAAASFSTMTALADTLVRTEGIPFRSAHEICATVTRRLLDADRSAASIEYADVAAVAESRLGRPLRAAPETIEAAVDPAEAVAGNDVLGGTAPERVRTNLERQKDRLDDQRSALEATTAALADRESALDDRCSAIQDGGE